MSAGGPYEVELSLPGDRPQLYAIILEVHDLAGNVAYARRLVMFDNSSSVMLLDSATVLVVSADPRSSNPKFYLDVYHFIPYLYGRFYFHSRCNISFH